MKLLPLSVSGGPEERYRLDVAVGVLAVGAGGAFAVEYADVVTQAILTVVQSLIEVAVAMLTAPGQTEAASILVLVSALCVGFAVVVVWYIRRRRAEYG